MAFLNKCTKPLKIGDIVRNYMNGQHLMVVTATNGRYGITLRGYGTVVKGVFTPVKRGRVKQARKTALGGCYVEPYWFYQHVTMQGVKNHEKR